MRRAALAAALLLLLWQLRTAAAVNVGHVELMQAVMAHAHARFAVGYTAPAPIAGRKMERAARAFAFAGDGRLPLRGTAQTRFWAGDYRGAAPAIDRAIEAHGGIRERLLAAEIHLHAGDRPRAVAEWIAASRDAGLLLPTASLLLLQVPGGDEAEGRRRANDIETILAVALDRPGLTATESGVLLRTIARAYETINDLASADNALRPLISDGKPDPDTLAMLAGIAYQGHRWSDAERFARASIAADAQRTRWAAHDVLGRLALDRCDLATAADQFREGLAEPFDGDYTYYSLRWLLGLVEYEQSDIQRALADWQQYFDAQPHDADRREVMGQAVAGALARRCGTVATPRP